MIKYTYAFLVFISFMTLFIGQVTQGMVFDNRFLPLYYKPFTRRVNPVTCAPLSHFRLQPFFMRSERANGEHNSISVPDIQGKYDEVEIAKVLVRSNCLKENPFRSDLQAIPTIPWKREGRINAQGLAFFYEQAIGCHWAFGTSFLFMHISSHSDFFLDSSCIDVRAGDRKYLFDLKSRLDKKLGLTPPLFSKTGFGDMDFYVRYGSMWYYICKFRRIDAGLKLGFLAPTSTHIPHNNPAAIPFGGPPKHWGIYLEPSAEFELREDWYAGLLLRAIKRLPRTSIQRLPLDLEPINYGAIVGDFRINPGWTFVFNPYISLEALREGFGVKVLYTLVSHLKDRITDKRKDQSIPVNTELAQDLSSWGLEHVTIGALYDFAKFRDNCSWLPTISLYWDIPVDWAVSKRSARTNAVSLMVEMDF